MNQENLPTADQKLDRLFASYREACPDAEPSANFMPGVWARIDARRGWTWHARRYAQRIAMAAAAACALIAGVQLGSGLRADPLISQSYVDILQDHAAPEDYAYLPTMEVAERF
jgi:hypothetical protein